MVTLLLPRAETGTASTTEEQIDGDTMELRPDLKFRGNTVKAVGIESE
jgi:hypothetical protein